MIHRSTSLRLCLLVALLGMGRSSAQATLLAYEGFDYPANTTIAGNTGGSGWANAWAAGVIVYEMATNQPAGLIYTDSGGQTLMTTGGSLIVGNPDGPSAFTTIPYRALNNNLSGGSGTTPGPGGTVWISLLYQRLNLEAGGAPYFRQANLGLRESFTERLAIGGPNTSATVSNVFSVWSNRAVHSGGAPFQSAAHPLLPSTTTFILVKVVTDGTSAADTAYVWFNPTNLTAEPDPVTADLTDDEVNLSGVNTVQFLAVGHGANGTNAAFQVDELRLGTTFTDVTPSVAYGESPTIVDDPQGLNVLAGQQASFTVTAVGTTPLAYQWFFNTNTPLPNATNEAYSIASTVLENAGGYSVVVTNSSGAATSVVATLTVETPELPQITVHPQSLTNLVTFPAKFTATAIGTPPLHYQWYYDTNTPLAGETKASLSFTIDSTNATGGYTVVVTNNYGAITSAVARLTVLPRLDGVLPAFPGADGAGRYASGGRYGIVYHVTKLNSQLDDPERYSPGTFLYGLQNGNFPSGVPRTIVFDVAGVFHLGIMDTTNWTSGGNAWDAASRQGVGANNLTIAGQTAPGPVIFMGGSLKPQGNNQIYRNITIAGGYGMEHFWEPGQAAPTPGSKPTTFTMDAMDISGQNIMVDHISVFFCTDESLSHNEVADELTIQYAHCSLSQNYQTHAYAHAFGGGTDKKISCINNFDAHHFSRIPRLGAEVGTGSFNDFRNNLIYNWSKNNPGYSGIDQYSKNNFIQNFYLQGSGAKNGGLFQGGTTAITWIHLDGNLLDENMDGDPNDTFLAHGGNGQFNQFTPVAQAYDIGIGVTLDARDSFTNVLRYAGSRWWERDYDISLGNTAAISSIEERLIHDAVVGTGDVINWADDPFNNDPNEGAEWRALWALRMDTYGAAPFNRPAGWDTDQDGMPDTWETEHGLNPNVANNNDDFDNDFYTDLEEYMNEIAAWPAPGAIYFIGEQDSRYAPIFNWRVYGVNVNISGIGNLPTSSQWQPSRYDMAVIANQTVFVDAVGQHAGELKLMSSSALNITNGWLKVATRFENGAGCTTTVSGPGALTTSNLLNSGMLRLTGAAGLNVSGTFTNTGTLDIMSWNGTLPGGLVNLGTILDGSLIVITDYEVSGADVIVTIQGYTGHNYQLQFRDDLTSGSWQNVGSAVAGADAPIVFTHTNGAAGQQRFYQVLVD